jgi:hypothetical protein
MGLQHAYQVTGANDAAKEVSRDRWNADHVLVGELTLPDVASPATPAAGNVNLFGTDIHGIMRLGFKGPDGKLHVLGKDLGEFSVNRWQPAPGLNSIVGENSLNLIAIGTATARSVAATNLHWMQPRTEFLVTTASTTAIAGLRGNSGQKIARIGRDANAPGGFLMRQVWGPALGAATSTTRAFCGMESTAAAPTDVEPSSRTNFVGMAWDAADTNIQMMHNDGSGAATKIDLGSGFPVPTTNQDTVYEVQLFSPDETTQSVSYRVIRYNTNDKTIAAEATGTITTNLPPVATTLQAMCVMSVGGTSSQIGVAVMGVLVAREY